MQARGRGAARPPIGIAVEGDLARRIDAALALSMLNGLVSKTQARNIAVAISRPSLKTAQVADVIVGFYSGRPIGGFANIGMPETGPATDDAPAVAAILTTKGAEGTEPYSSNITRLIDTPDNAVLIRNMLLAQHDGNAAIVLAGPATGMVRLMGLYGARPQIEAKVRQLVVAIGAYPTGAAEASVRDDIAAARRLFAEWPTPIVAVGAEVGAALPYPGASIERDFAWSPAHPVVDAYRAVKAMPYDAPAPALAAMLHAVDPDGGFFKLSEPGTITVLDDGRTQFTPAPDGKHRYLIADPAQKDHVLKLYTDLVSAQPAPRPGRGGRGAAAAAAQQQQQQQQQQQEQPAPQARPQSPAPQPAPPAGRAGRPPAP
jgi:hypothetical protein